MLRCAIVRTLCKFQVPRCSSSLRNFTSDFPRRNSKADVGVPNTGPLHKLTWQLCRDDGDDFECHRIDNQNAVTDQDVIEAAIFRHDTHDVFGQYRNVHVSRNSRECLLPLKRGACSLPITA